MSTLLDEDPLIFYDPTLSDGCTCAPDFDFVKCCIIHDEDYWRASTEKERKLADDSLYYCIKSYGIEKNNKLLYAAIAYVYWIAVRVFGRFFWIDKPNQSSNSIFKTPGFRWLSKTIKWSTKLLIVLIGLIGLIGFIFHAVRKNKHII